MPDAGDIVSIYWPGDTISFKVPEGSKPGETVKLHLSDILEMAPPPEPGVEVHVVPIDPLIQDTSTPPPYYVPGGNPPFPAQPQQYQPPPGAPNNRQPHAGKCRNCGSPIMWHWSVRSHQGKGGWYMCNDLNRRNFHTRQICAATQAAKAQGIPIP